MKHDSSNLLIILFCPSPVISASRNITELSHSALGKVAILLVCMTAIPFEGFPTSFLGSLVLVLHTAATEVDFRMFCVFTVYKRMLPSLGNNCQTQSCIPSCKVLNYKWKTVFLKNKHLDTI